MVYRPQKSKPAGPGFPKNRPEADPLEGPLTPSPSSRPDGVRAGDDRNLVTVDDYAGGDLEDKAWLFWHRHQKRVIGAILVVCAVVLVWQGSRIYQDMVFKKLQEAYAQADTPAALVTFAKENPATDLGKIAQLRAADAYFKAGQYDEAITAYDDAATVWGADANGQRARFGRAMSRLQKGDAAAGQSELENIYGETEFNDNYRAQSAYFLATLAVKAGDGATAGKWIDRAKSFPQAEPWPSQAAELADTAAIVSGVSVTSTTRTTNAGVSVDIGATEIPNPTPPPARGMNVAPPPVPAAPATAPGANPPPSATTTPAAPDNMNLPPLAPLQQ